MKHKDIHVEDNARFFDGNIKRIAKDNDFFRRVLYTGPHSQLVVMSIPVGDDIGEEAHANTDQILFVVDGDGQAILNGEVQPAEEHSVIFVTAGTRHNIKNIGHKALKLFTVYAPPEHAEGTVHKTKEEAMHEEHA
jgi:mannose-6-phosphate isomerase-like protein (cupin superfamily)